MHFLGHVPYSEKKVMKSDRWIRSGGKGGGRAPRRTENSKKRQPPCCHQVPVTSQLTNPVIKKSHRKSRFHERALAPLAAPAPQCGSFGHSHPHVGSLLQGPEHSVFSQQYPRMAWTTGCRPQSRKTKNTKEGSTRAGTRRVALSTCTLD